MFKIVIILPFATKGQDIKPDHIEAVKLFKNIPTLFCIHEEEWKLVKSMEKYLNMSLKVDISSFSPDFFLKQGEFSIKGLEFNVIHTPGHSPGSIFLFWPEKKSIIYRRCHFQEISGSDGFARRKRNHAQEKYHTVINAGG